MHDPHTDHPDATLSLTEPTAEGGLLFQSWAVCACTLPALRAQLGRPHHESLASAEQVRATGAAVMSVDSGLYVGAELSDNEEK